MSSGRVRLSKKTRVDYTADFETTTDPEALPVRVWSWGLVKNENASLENVELGTDIDSFIARIQRHNCKVYFHNLAFDGKFILDWMFKHGYVYTDKRISIEPGEFKTTISGMGGKFYSITVRWANGKTTEFWDSAKKLPMSVERVGETFETGETKGEIDYDAPRPVGYVPTDAENDYQRRDVVIVAKALELQKAQGLDKMTVASDAMAEFKSLFGKKTFERMFPVLPKHMDAELRKAYRGGFTYCDPRTSREVVGGGLVLDVNSLYPHVMYSKLLPYGEPVYHRGYVELTESRPLSIFQVTFTAKLKKDHIPCIQLKGHSLFGEAEYLSHIAEPETLWVTSTDWELWNDHYDIEVQAYEGGWSFKGVIGVFDEYIEKWMRVKATSTGGRREIAKLMLNSLYGKFGANPNVTGKVPYLDDDGIVKFKLGPNETRDPVYTPMAAFITAYARELTIRAAQANYATFAYADTDSLHLLTHTLPEALTIHPSDIGAWKLEYHFSQALYWRAKFYMEKDVVYPNERRQDYVNHVAGLPPVVAQSLTFDDVVEGMVIDERWFKERNPGSSGHGKLTPKSLPGGVVLVPTKYTVK